MAFCKNCGCELKEGAKFCPECGASMPQENGNDKVNDPVKINESGNSGESVLSKIDRFGMFYGIGLLILAFVFCFVEPPFFKIVLAFLAIFGAIFCLARKYRLKVFPILALITAVVCLFMGLVQSNDRGLFTTARKYKEQKKAELEKLEEEIEQDNDSDIDALIADAVEDAEKANEKALEEAETADEEVESTIDEAVEKEKPSEETSDDSDKEEKEETAQEVKEPEKEEKPAGGVDPDLKAFLDSYEDFVDEYVDFMKKYKSDPTNVLSMIGEYGEIMQKYEDFAKKVDQYDTNTMSTEDAKYYLEVTNRCTQKMLGVL